MSDLLFSAQVYFMIGLFIFIIKRKSWVAVAFYILILFTALHVRYSAMVFPFALIPFFLMKKGKIRWVVVLLSIFVFHTFYSQIKKSMKETTGIEQFSTGFDGWNYINNVLYVLPHIDLKVENLKFPKLKELHTFIMNDMDTIKSVINSDVRVSTIILWDPNLTLKQYLFKTMQEKQASYLPTFVKLGSGLYKDYAFYVMMHYPFSYIRYYCLPNFVQTFYPSPGCLPNADVEKHKEIYEYYEIEEENAMLPKYDVLKSPHYHFTMKMLHLITWAIIIGIGIAAIVKRKKLVFSFDDKVVFWGMLAFAVIYYASSIFAAAMEIRYTISMHAIQFAFCYILLNKLVGNQKKS